MRFFVWQSRQNLKEQEIDFAMKMMIAPLLFSEIILYDVLTSAAH